MGRRGLAALLLPMLLAGCFGSGADGVAAPPPGALADARPSGPNTAIAGPAGFTPAPDIITRRYPVPAARLYRAITEVAGAEPRTFPLAHYPDRLEASYVIRSRLLNFPDVLTLQVLPRGEAASELAMHSASRYGYSDFGVNRARLRHWLDRLDAMLATSGRAAVAVGGPRPLQMALR